MLNNLTNYSNETTHSNYDYNRVSTFLINHSNVYSVNARLTIGRIKPSLETLDRGAFTRETRRVGVVDFLHIRYLPLAPVRQSRTIRTDSQHQSHPRTF